MGVCGNCLSNRRGVCGNLLLANTWFAATLWPTTEGFAAIAVRGQRRPGFQAGEPRDGHGGGGRERGPWCWRTPGPRRPQP
eukprot:3532320-Lingulodinium_polyedra.AAC.1